MDFFIKAIAGILIGVIFCTVLAKQEKDLSILLCIAVCCIVMIAAMEYLKPVVDFCQKLKNLGKLDPQLLSILLKASGLCILAEIAGLICSDSGNSALGKGLQILSTAVILWLCIPLLDELITLVETILGAI